MAGVGSHRHHDHHHAHHAHGGHHPHPGDGGGGQRKWPFLWGSQEQRIQVAQIPVTPGLKAATIRVPKNGFLSELRFRFVGSINITTPGTTPSLGGAPNIFNIIQSYICSYNGGFQYRNLSGEDMYVMDLVRYAGPDAVMGGPSYLNYAPQTGGAQSIGFMMRDPISLNTQANADKYLLAAHARNADVTIDITFAPNPNGTYIPFYGVGANTEIGTISGTLFIDGLYLLDPPSYARFEKPNIDRVQQIESDTSFTQIVTGQNTISIVPLNGPKYMMVLMKATFNGIANPVGFGSAVTQFELKINNGLDRINAASQIIAQENCQQLQRIVTGVPGTTTPGALPPGWYMFDFLNDASINNAITIAGRNVISTQRIGSLWLMPTVASGTNLSANNMFKIIKRVDLPAVGGTNRLASPQMEAA